MALTRADARARSTRRDPLARLPRPLRDQRRAAALPRRQLARPPAQGHPRAPAPRGRPVGRGARRRLARLDRARPTRTGDALAEVIGARARHGARDRQRHGQPLQARQRDPGQPTRASRALVTDQDNFPTDRYVLEGIARSARPGAARSSRRPTRCTGRSRTRSRTGLVVLSPRRLPQRRAGRHRRPSRARSSGTSRTPPGAVPVRLREPASSYAVGCTYKYLNAGPGALGYLYVARARSALRTPDPGLVRPGAPVRDGPARTSAAPGIGRFLAGTPPILVLAAVEEGVRITAEAGIEAIREKSVAQTELLIALHDEWLAPLGFTLGSPRDAAHPRLAREPAPRRGVADLQGADRARERRPGLPRARLRAARHRAALHPLRRRLRRDGAAARPRRARRAPRDRRHALDASPRRTSPPRCGAASPPRSCPRCG